MEEAAIEARLRDGIKKLGGRAYKFESPGNDGVPDRLVCLPGGHSLFVETKAPGKKPRPLQVIQIKLLHQFGFMVFVADSPETVDNVLSYCKGLISNEI